MIEARNLHKTYVLGGSEVRALDGVSVNIRAGEFVAVMGPSGSGKSTLLQVLGLLDVPDAGSYKLLGREVAGLGPDELAALRSQSLGFIFQQFNLLARTSAAENVALPRLYHPGGPEPSRAAELLKMVGLADRMDHTPAQLSGGQQQRVAIARALMNRPALLFADEPTGNLDSKSSHEILDILASLNRQGISVVMVTHEADIAARASRVIVMKDGKIVSDRGKRPPAKARREAAGPQAPGAARGWLDAMATYTRQALRALVANKVRSFLSVLGILIGVGAVIATMAIGEGTKATIKKQFASMGTNLLLVWATPPSQGGVRGAGGTAARLGLDDVEALARKVPEVSYATAEVSGRVQAVGGGKNWATQVSGVGLDYDKVRASTPVIGRFFTQEDIAARARVTLLGVSLARQLFGESNPVGQTVRFNRVYFKVIGVLPAKGSSGWRDEDDKALVPVTTAMYRLLGRDSIDVISLEVKDTELMAKAQENIKALMRQRLRTPPEKDDPIQIFDMADAQKTFTGTIGVVTTVLAVVAGISLFVGGIGIMNIMLVSVTERTREIGLRKALGARGRDVLMQFLIEAVVVSVLGGLAGLALGALTAMLVTLATEWNTQVSGFSVALAVLFSAGVGVVFGMWPARKASRLDPIQALRYE